MLLPLLEKYAKYLIICVVSLIVTTIVYLFGKTTNQVNGFAEPLALYVF